MAVAVGGCCVEAPDALPGVRSGKRHSAPGAAGLGPPPGAGG